MILLLVVMVVLLLLVVCATGGKEGGTIVFSQEFLIKVVKLLLFARVPLYTIVIS